MFCTSGYYSNVQKTNPHKGHPKSKEKGWPDKKKQQLGREEKQRWQTTINVAFSAEGLVAEGNAKRTQVTNGKGLEQKNFSGGDWRTCVTGAVDWPNEEEKKRTVTKLKRKGKPKQESKEEVIAKIKNQSGNRKREPGSITWKIWCA